MSRHMLSHRDKGTPLYERLGKQGSHAIGALVAMSIALPWPCAGGNDRLP